MIQFINNGKGIIDMDNRKQVSVLVLLYKSQIEKVFCTLSAIIKQKNIRFEIIISDDGSENDHFSQIKEYFDETNFRDYILTKCKRNMGTVENYNNALQNSRGEYVFATSPGDILFDDRVLSDLYNFARSNHSLITFGNAVYYCCEGNKIKFITSRQNYPPRPSIFDGKHSPFMEKSALFFGGSILGATFFRERNNAVKYLEKIRGIAKYVEDNTCTFFAVAEGIRIRYYDRQMVWYDYGSGISTDGTTQSKSLLAKDFDAVYCKIKKIYPEDPIIDAAYFNRFVNIKPISILYRVFKHPILFISLCRIKFIYKKEVGCTEEDKNELKILLYENRGVDIYASY